MSKNRLPAAAEASFPQRQRQATSWQPEIWLRLLVAIFRHRPRTHGSCLRERLRSRSRKENRAKKDLLPLLDQITKSGKPLLIVAEDVGSEALATLVVNKLRGPLRVAAVRAPGSGDQRKHMLQDVVRLTGGKAIIEDDLPLGNMQISDLGQAKKITIDKNNTVIEGRVVFDQLPFKSGAYVHPNGSHPAILAD